MTNNSKSQLDDRSRVAPTKASDDLSTLCGRLAAHVHFQLMDHAFLRALWTNLDEIAPGVWRSNQPSPRRIRRYRDMGISTIISLRGGVGKSHHMFEERACAETGITLITVALSARKLLDRTRYLELFDLFDSVEKPFLMHCKSGADRAGLASAL
uniref:tyrosine-protein phosphatase n=1 Tax=Actibacterium sp. TaxID=1872125 RepID=UPI0035616F2C